MWFLFYEAYIGISSRFFFSFLSISSCPANLKDPPAISLCSHFEKQRWFLLSKALSFTIQWMNATQSRHNVWTTCAKRSGFDQQLDSRHRNLFWLLAQSDNFTFFSHCFSSFLEHTCHDTTQRRGIYVRFKWDSWHSSR